MNTSAPETLTVLPDPKLFRVARSMQRVCLILTAVGVLFGVLPLWGIALGGSGAEARGAVPLIVTSLLCGLSLGLSGVEWNGVAWSYAQRAANLLAIFAAAVAVFWSRAASVAVQSQKIVFPPTRLVLGFVMLTMIMVLIDKKNWMINRIVDVLVCALCLLSQLLCSDSVFGRFALFGASTQEHHTAAMACLIALTIVVTLRQAEHGVFSVFLAVGIGGNLARIFAPILVVLPFAWEALNTWLSKAGGANHLNAALLGSGAVGVAVGILLFFAWRISKMENEIHDLILRDEATRLYNFRGFNMLAEHALRLAQRSNVPFSVLFVNLENLAQVHAELGPNASAAALREAGEILKATFRESDIKGRIGGDEFAVAGQFDRAGISVAALRLEAATAVRNAKGGRAIALKFSLGHVTTSGAGSEESLKEMLDRAGQMRNRHDGLLREMLVN
jgi:diguanylate cyclase (GGDEF)-like protein